MHKTQKGQTNVLLLFLILLELFVKELNL